jgi:CRISPR system Cascade subunit CasC
MAESVNAMAAQVDSLETMYGNTGERRYVSTIHNWSRDSDGKASLPDSIEQSLNDIFGTKE